MSVEPSVAARLRRCCRAKFQKITKGSHLEVEDFVAHAEANDGADDVADEDEDEGGGLEHDPHPPHDYHQPAPHAPQHRHLRIVLLPSSSAPLLAIGHLAMNYILAFPIGLLGCSTDALLHSTDDPDIIKLEIEPSEQCVYCFSSVLCEIDMQRGDSHDM